MDRYITRDKLADFISRMWDAGLRTECRPADNEIAVTGKEDYKYIGTVRVFDKLTYDGMVEDIIKEISES